MGTEVVTLTLEEVGRDNLAPVAIEEGQGRAERGSGNAPEDSLGNDAPPTGLCLVDSWKIYDT